MKTRFPRAVVDRFPLPRLCAFVGEHFCRQPGGFGLFRRYTVEVKGIVETCPW